jgi:hypothetical protein
MARVNLVDRVRVVAHAAAVDDEHRAAKSRLAAKQVKLSPLWLGDDALAVVRLGLDKQPLAVELDNGIEVAELAATRKALLVTVPCPVPAAPDERSPVPVMNFSTSLMSAISATQ